MHTLLSLNSAPARELPASTNLDRRQITQTLLASAEESEPFNPVRLSRKNAKVRYEWTHTKRTGMSSYYKKTEIT